MTKRLAALGLAILLLAATAAGGDWPQFRGPGGTGLTAESGLPAEWAADKNIAWKVAVRGAGWSGPVVSGDRVFLTTAVSDRQKRPKPFRLGDAPPPAAAKDAPKDAPRAGGQKPPDAVYRWQVLCLDRATGKTLWQRTAAEGKPTQPIQETNTYASETPATDGERVYAYFGTVGLFCYDLDGGPLWEKSLGSYRMGAGFGTGASPALADGRVFVQYDNEERSFLVALDAKTGRELWRAERKERSSWCTPLVWRANGRTEVVACGPGGSDEDDDGRVRSYDAATGEVLWELRKVRGGFSASPVADGERLYVGANGPFSNGPLYAVRAGARGDITPKPGERSSAGLAWLRTGSNLSLASPLVCGGHLYVLGARSLSCYDARTGEPRYVKERLPGARNCTASPWAYDGKVFCLDEDGQTFVVRAGPAFQLLGKNRLDEMCWATPAVCGGALFLRGVEHLYCIKP